MSTARLTDALIRSLPPPEKGHTVAWDDLVTGFGVRVSQGGTKSYFVMYGRDRRRKQIGRVGIVPLGEAREAARRFLARLTLGNDAEPTHRFKEALDAFLASQGHLASSTLTEYTRILKTRFEPSLKEKRLADITTEDIATILDKLSKTPAEQKYCHSVIRRFFRWAVGRRMLRRSPLEGMDVPKPPKSRDRVLSDDELKLIWKATSDGSNYSTIVRLLMLTGQRRDEIANLDPSWIIHTNNAASIAFPASAMKNGREHLLPISSTVSELLKGLKPSNSWSKNKKRLDKKLGPDFKPWVLHDLRRSYATNLARLGVRLETTENLLGHVGSRSGIVGVYQRYSFQDEMREAVMRMEAHLLTLFSKQS